MLGVICIVLVGVVILNVNMLSVLTQNVTMLSVVAPNVGPEVSSLKVTSTNIVQALI